MAARPTIGDHSKGIDKWVIDLAPDGATLVALGVGRHLCRKLNLSSMTLCACLPRFPRCRRRIQQLTWTTTSTAARLSWRKEDSHD